MSGLSDAIYVKGDSLACTPNGSDGTCRKWFGRCVTADSSKLNVLFKVHNDADSAQTNMSDAVYMKSSGVSCVPDGSPDGECRRWFGLPQTQDGRAVVCRLFDDGYTNMTAPTRSIYYKSSGKVCMPGSEPDGICRKWFGRCEVDPNNTCTTFTYSSWGQCQANGTQSRTVLTKGPSGCTGGQPNTIQSCQYTPPPPPPPSCITFHTVNTWSWIFFTYNEGCANGVKYCWNDPALSFGSNTFFNVQKCFDKPQKPCGTCPLK